MALLYGRAGRLTIKNGGFRPGQFTADVGIGGCAATCAASRGDTWLDAQLAALCPPTVTVAASLPFHLPAGVTLATSGLFRRGPSVIMPPSNLLYMENPYSYKKCQ